MYTPLNEEERQQALQSAFGQLEEALADRDLGEVAFEFTGSVQSHVLLHLIWRQFRRLCRFRKCHQTRDATSSHG